MTDEKPTNTTQQNTEAPAIAANLNTVMVASSVGALAGLGYAFANKKKFWGYAGFFLLGSIAGGLVGNIISTNK